MELSVLLKPHVGIWQDAKRISTCVFLYISFIKQTLEVQYPLHHLISNKINKMLFAKFYVHRFNFWHSLVQSDDGYSSLIMSNNDTGG